jgi:subtilisin family serine protease
LGAYRVFGCPGDSTATDVMAAAIYKAADDGADVINLSIGGGRMCSFLLSYSLWIINGVIVHIANYADDADAIAAATVGKAGHIVLGSNGFV